MTTPYYQDDHVTIYHGDCREVTEWLSADVLVTDPPYGIGWNQASYLTVGRSEGTRTKQHDGIANDEDTSARDEALAMWAPRPALVFGACETPTPKGTRRTLVFHKPADSGLFGSIIWRKDWEPIYMVGKWPTSPATESSVIRTRYGSHREYAQGVHPHAKPDDVLKRLIAKCPPGVVADPFMGSGSTLRAAKDLGRKAIGIELDERYCEIAANRMGQEVLDFGGVA
jgi:site-specific DNA-methyltransferase (adenine-specific)